jgi:flagellar biosynthesis protein FliQ
MFYLIVISFFQKLFLDQLQKLSFIFLPKIFQVWKKFHIFSSFCFSFLFLFTASLFPQAARTEQETSSSYFFTEPPHVTPSLLSM